MKKLLILAFWVFELIETCTPRATIAQSLPDQGQCPWRLPFCFSIQCSGTEYQSAFAYNMSNGAYDQFIARDSLPNSSSFFTAIIDTSSEHSKLTMGLDTLSYMDYLDTGLANPFGYITTHVSIQKHLSIAFASGKDSIIFFEYAIDSSVWSDEYHYSNSSSLSFRVNGLKYSRDTLIQSESNFSCLFGSEHTSNYHRRDNLWLDAAKYRLTGIFHPFISHAGSVAVTRGPQLLHISGLNDKLQCSFSSSPEARSLEVYSLIGAKVVTANIQPGTTEVVLPKLPNGFYVVRLGGEVEKIYVRD